MCFKNKDKDQRLIKIQPVKWPNQLAQGIVLDTGCTGDIRIKTGNHMCTCDVVVLTFSGCQCGGK
jgi:hypothetical protein